MKCLKCGYEASGQFTQCPSCGTVQGSQPYHYSPTQQAYNADPSQHTTADTIAITVGIVVSALSLIAAFVILIGYSSYLATKTAEENGFGIDAFDDFDSNEYDDIEDFFQHYYSSDAEDNSDSGLNVPLSFKEKLYSFSEGEVETEYSVSITQTYRGEAALKLLEGDILPTYNEFSNEIYLVRFKIVITNQDKDAIVPAPLGNPVAYRDGTTGIFSEGYDTIENLSYANRNKLIKKGEELETWMAFIVSKNDSSPCVRWNAAVNQEFRNTGKSISDPAEVEAGAAIEKTSSEAPAEEPDSVDSSN